MADVDKTECSFPVRWRPLGLAESLPLHVMWLSSRHSNPNIPAFLFVRQATNRTSDLLRLIISCLF